MRIDDFDFDLPEQLIALRPARPRDSARLLQITRRDADMPCPAPDEGQISAQRERLQALDTNSIERASVTHSEAPQNNDLAHFRQSINAGNTLSDGGYALKDGVFRDILAELRAGDALVLNETKVMPAALIGHRAARPQGGGGGVSLEVTLHKRHPSRLASGVIWDAFIRPAKRVRPGDELNFGESFCASVIARDGAEARLHFPLDDTAFNRELAAHGTPPLPPYIGRKRAVDAADRTDYQTVFAKAPGSVAAPTAGLHFTEALLRKVREKGVAIEAVTLHVGAGTFLPVQSKDTSNHHMHSEWGEISASVAHRLRTMRQMGGRIIAVGTTSLRLLESAAARDGFIRPFRGETDIFITPGFEFNAVDALITNFHLPRSTLFMLVSAFAGYERMRAAYRYAIAKKYRFYSYGDACYLTRYDR